VDLREALVSALASLAAHKLRSALTVLGIVFGVGAVISMLSIGAGAERQAMENISRLGLHNVVVRSKEMDNDEEKREMRTQSPGLSLRDSEAIQDAVDGARRVAPKITVDPQRIRSATGTTDGSVFGVSPMHRELAHLSVAEGRFLDELDIRQHAQVAVLGDQVRANLFGHENPLGQHLKVDDVWFEVIGVLAREGGEVDTFQGVSLGSPATAIYLPFSTVLRKLDREPLASPLSEIVVELEDPELGQQAAHAIDSLLERLHAGVDDFELVVPQALLAESQRTQRLFNIVMGCIAGISLLVGGIGIMNIMLATVLERTREIGIRRAVGARRRDIRFQFLVEAFSLSALGGIAGVLLGLSIARIVALSAGWPTLVTLWSILLATGVALVVGLLSGLYPAHRAAGLDPIESLRYE
jgi:putative ABC transport system permease protein